jgi:hypothetical protein
LQAKFAELDLDVRSAKQAAAERRLLDELKAQITAAQDQAEELKRVHAAEVGRLGQLLAQAEAKVQTLLAAQAEIEAKSAVLNESQAGAAESKGDDGLPEPEAPQAPIKASRKRKSPMADSTVVAVVPVLVGAGASAAAGDDVADDRAVQGPAKRARTRAQHQAVQEEEGDQSKAKRGKKGKKGKRK